MKCLSKERIDPSGCKVELIELRKVLIHTDEIKSSLAILNVQVRQLFNIRKIMIIVKGKKNAGTILIRFGDRSKWGERG